MKMISFHILRMLKRLNYADKQSVYILKKEQSTQCLDSQRTNEMIKKNKGSGHGGHTSRGKTHVAQAYYSTDLVEVGRGLVRLVVAALRRVAGRG